MRLQDKLSQFGSLDYKNLLKQAKTSVIMQTVIKHAAALLCSEVIFTGDPHNWQDCLQVTRLKYMHAYTYQHLFLSILISPLLQK
jgi:hypothetical protein